MFDNDLDGQLSQLLGGGGYDSIEAQAQRDFEEILGRRRGGRPRPVLAGVEVPAAVDTSALMRGAASVAAETAPPTARDHDRLERSIESLRQHMTFGGGGIGGGTSLSWLEVAGIAGIAIIAGAVLFHMVQPRR